MNDEQLDAGAYNLEDIRRGVQDAVIERFLLDTLYIVMALISGIVVGYLSY